MNYHKVGSVPEATSPMSKIGVGDCGEGGVLFKGKTMLGKKIFRYILQGGK